MAAITIIPLVLMGTTTTMGIATPMGEATISIMAQGITTATIGEVGITVEDVTAEAGAIIAVVTDVMGGEEVVVAAEADVVVEDAAVDAAEGNGSLLWRRKSPLIRLMLI